MLSPYNFAPMSYTVDFKNVSTIGLESSPVAASLAGLRASEAKYFMNKYKLPYTTIPVSESPETIEYVHKILKDERGIVINSTPLELAIMDVDNIHWVFVYYESGLALNVLYTVSGPKKRAVGFKLSEGMDVPEELGKFKFARMKSKLAGVIRGTYFVIKGEYL